jgi:hypothetical protein
MNKTSNPTRFPGVASRALRRLQLKPFCGVLAMAWFTTLSLAPAQGAATTTEAKPEAQAVKPAAAAQVKLLAAGANPRKVLRLHPKAGDKQTLDMNIKMAMDMAMGDNPNQSMKLPPIKMTADMTVKSVAPGGDISYELVMSEVDLGEEPDAMPQVVEAMKSSLGGLKGLVSTGVMSDRGISKSIEMKLPPDADPQTRQTVEQMKEAFSKMGIRVPEEAVGPGAKWDFKETVKSQGMTMDQASTYELVSIEGDRLTAKTTVAQSAARQKVQSPAMQGADVELTSMSGNGKGDVTVDLGKILPSKANANVHTEFAMDMDMGGQKTTMAMKMDMTISLQAK